MKTVFKSFIIALIVFSIRQHQDTRKQNLINEAIDYKENIQTQIYYDEFNNKYFIDINGEIYEQKDIITINELEDLDTYKNIAKYININ